MNKKLFFIFVFVLIALPLAYAQDSSETGTFTNNGTFIERLSFLNGTFTNTYYNFTNDLLRLNSTSVNGFFTSQTFNGTSGTNLSNWTSMSWWQKYPYGISIASNKGTDSGQYTNTFSASGAKALYRLDALSGNLIDSAGEGRDMTITGSITRGQTGLFNKSISLDGLGNYATINAYPDVNNGSFLSGFAWVKGTPQSIKIIYGHWDSPERSWYMSSGLTPFQSKFRVAVTNDLASTVYKSYTTSVTVLDNNWHHVGFTWNSGTLKLYVDGVEDTAVTKDRDDAFTTVVTAAGKIGIGVINPSTTPANFFNGTLDELSHYNRTLSQNEITNLYERGASKFDIEVRSCMLSSCAAGTYERINPTSPQTLSVAPNTYFQYRFNFTSLNKTFSPELFNVSVNYTELNTVLPDTFPPTPSNIVSSPVSPVIYTTPQNYQFNVTWTDDTAVNNVIFEHNFTGVMINESPSGNVATEYFLNKTDLNVGYYVWASYGNDTSGNIAKSAQQQYNIYNRITSELSLTLQSLSEDISIQEGTDVNVTAQVITGLPFNGTLSRDGTNLSSGTSVSINQNLPTGTYVYTFTYPINDNFTASSVTRTLTVTTTTDTGWYISAIVGLALVIFILAYLGVNL